jgi:hypothetical protein
MTTGADAETPWHESAEYAEPWISGFALALLELLRHCRTHTLSDTHPDIVIPAPDALKGA